MDALLIGVGVAMGVVITLAVTSARGGCSQTDCTDCPQEWGDRGRD